jgi:hypothetical protein
MLETGAAVAGFGSNQPTNVQHFTTESINLLQTTTHEKQVFKKENYFVN